MRILRHIFLIALLLAAITAAAPGLAATEDKTEAPAPAAAPAPHPKGDNPYEEKAYSDPFYAEIVEEAKTKSPRDLVAFLELKIQDKPDRIKPAALWLRDNSINQRDITKVDSLYFMLYSDVMRQLALAYKQARLMNVYMDMLKTSVMALYVYELMGSVDALRCADPSALSAMRQDTLLPRYERLDEAFSIISKEDFDLFTKTAFAADKKFEQRKPNEYICSLGVARLNDMLREDGVQTFDAPNPATGEKSMRVIPPKGYTYTPTYVNDTEWAERREKMRKRMKLMWKDRFERLSPSPATPPAPAQLP